MVAGVPTRQDAPARGPMPQVTNAMLERPVLMMWRACVVIAFSLGLSACAKTVETPPVVDMAFRIAAPQPCLACEEVGYSDTKRQGATPLYLQRRPLLNSRDIRNVSRGEDSATGRPILVFTFQPEARAQIHRVTADHVGELAAWVVDGKVIYAANIASPFSDAMQVSGMDEDEQIRLYEILTSGKSAKRIGVDD